MAQNNRVNLKTLHASSDSEKSGNNLSSANSAKTNLKANLDTNLNTNVFANTIASVNSNVNTNLNVVASDFLTLKSRDDLCFRIDETSYNSSYNVSVTDMQRQITTNLNSNSDSHLNVNSVSNQEANDNTNITMSEPVHTVPLLAVNDSNSPTNSSNTHALLNSNNNNNLMISNADLDTNMEYEVQTSNRFQSLAGSLPDSSVQMSKKSKSSSDIVNDARYDEIFSLKMQLRKAQDEFSRLQNDYSKNINQITSRINSLSDSIALEDSSVAINTGFAAVKSPVKSKRKLPRRNAANVSKSAINQPLPMDADQISGPSNAPSMVLAQSSTVSNRSVFSGTSTVPAKVPDPTSSFSPIVGAQRSAKATNNSVNPSVNQASNLISPASSPSTKYPPFFIYNFSYKNFINTFPNLKFKMQVVNSNLKKFFVFNLKDYLSVRGILEENANVKFFTYTPKEIKPISYIIRGLDSSFSSDEVSNGLKDLIPGLDIVKSEPFSTAFSRRSGKAPNLWLVQLAPSSNSSEFRKIKFLLNAVVSIETLKSGGVVQCRNCQRFDHIAANCGMPFRCVKCDKAHGPGECLASEPATLVCVNCGGNHTANYGGCPRRAARISSAGPVRGAARVTSNNSNLRPPNFPALPSRRTPEATMPVSSNLSYANAVLRTTIPANNTSSSPIGFLQAEITSLFGCSLSAIISKFQAFIPSYSHTTDTNEKKMLLLSFLFDIVSNGA